MAKFALAAVVLAVSAGGILPGPYTPGPGPVEAPESLQLVASVGLILLLVAPKDPRLLQALDTTNRSLGDGGLVSSSLVYRYDAETSADGLAAEEGTFSTRTFWPVEALARAGRVAEARPAFERMLSYVNHPVLSAEESVPSDEAPGDFPQALTHPALVGAAFDLDRAPGAGM